MLTRINKNLPVIKNFAVLLHLDFYLNFWSSTCITYEHVFECRLSTCSQTCKFQHLDQITQIYIVLDAKYIILHMLLLT